MNNGKRYAYKNKVLKKLVTTRTCGLQLLLILMFIMFFAFHNRDLFQKERIVRRETGDEDDDDVDMDDDVGIECGYSFVVDRKIKMWSKTNVVIKFNKFSNCTRKRRHRGDTRYREESGASVFRVQAYSIYEMVTVTASYVGNESYKAQLLLTFPVKYTIMVLLVYVNGLTVHLLRHSRPLLRQLPGSPFHVNIFKDNSTNQETRYCTNKESGNVAGRWVKCGGAFPGLERCGAWLSPDFDFDGITGFRWVPYSCQYHQYTNDEVRKCFARNGWNSIVLTGDSHMKYRTYHWVTRLHGNCHECTKTPTSTEYRVFNRVPRIQWIFDARGTRLPRTFLNRSLSVEKLMNPKLTRDIPNPFDTDALQAKLYILNFGRFLLQETDDVMLINIKLHAYGKAAQMLQNMGKVVVWLNTVSVPWTNDDSGNPVVPPFRIKHFNRIAERIMRHYSIPVVDAFHISDGRLNAVHGRTYYVKNLPGNDFGGVVENTITNCIMNLLCNK